MDTIKKIKGIEIIDSRGMPTVEAEVLLDSGSIGRASVPSGASTGSKEAIELRDLDKSRYFGKGVAKAVSNINESIHNALVGQTIDSQRSIDSMLIELDGTSNKSRLGANSILAVSLAYAKASALNQGLSLYQSLSSFENYTSPVPMMNILNGGSHAENNIDIQEFMIIPIGLDSFSEAVRCGVEIFHSLKEILSKRGLNTAVGDEGGFAPDLSSNEDALKIISDAIENSDYTLGRDVFLGLDVASTEIYSEGLYYLKSEDKKFNSKDFCLYLEDLVSKYPIISIEDGMSEDDWLGWEFMSERFSNRIQLVGDDLFVTNTMLLSKGISKNVANSILIKPNQIGTLSETLDAISMADEASYSSIISHRSGETEDSTISDISIGTNATQIKTGSLCRSDRLAKYNQILRIEKDLGKNIKYASFDAFNLVF
ncbi:MAG: phosphopyruvate hydratase [Gammaproteobacteria bacterium TMED78]|nr:MAG: phosphopyruvate hydratase [Gammaproteobacteria bacterium TMED78]|tara:strand:- start:99178 stop:100461 length:1284 start_codon:yes stop_codon:yes gene_type:complete